MGEYRQESLGYGLDIPLKTVLKVDGFLQSQVLSACQTRFPMQDWLFYEGDLACIICLLGEGLYCTWLISPRNMANGKAIRHASKTFPAHFGGHTLLLNQPRARGRYRLKHSHKMPTVNPSIPRSSAMWYRASPLALSCSLHKILAHPAA